MTHDELLAKIDKELTCYCGHPDLCDGVQSKEQAPSWYALRAVVELHHEHTSGSGDIYCYNCQQKYPCLTIKAIQQEIA